MNIHYRYSKTFKGNFYEVVYALLTLSGVNITMLVNLFSLSLLPLLSGSKTGIWGWSPQPPTDFLRFSHKNTLLSTLLIEKRSIVPIEKGRTVL